MAYSLLFFPYIFRLNTNEEKDRKKLKKDVDKGYEVWYYEQAVARNGAALTGNTVERAEKTF